jgi:hypothetical protein
LVNRVLALSAALTIASKLIARDQTSAVDHEARLSTPDQMIWRELAAAALDGLTTIDYVTLRSRHGERSF